MGYQDEVPFTKGQARFTMIEIAMGMIDKFRRSTYVGLKKEYLLKLGIPGGDLGFSVVACLIPSYIQRRRDGQ